MGKTELRNVVWMELPSLSSFLHTLSPAEFKALWPYWHEMQPETTFWVISLTIGMVIAGSLQNHYS